MQTISIVSSRSLPMPSGVLRVPSNEEGVLQTRQPLGLEAVPRNRGLPITGQGSRAQSNKQTKTIALFSNNYIILMYHLKP